MRRYLVIIEQPQEPGEAFGVFCPDLPGCISVGRTEDEAVDNMAEAIALHLEGMIEDGEQIPESTVRAVEIAIPDPVVKRSAA